MVFLIKPNRLLSVSSREITVISLHPGRAKTDMGGPNAEISKDQIVPVKASNNVASAKTDRHASRLPTPVNRNIVVLIFLSFDESCSSVALFGEGQG